MRTADWFGIRNIICSPDSVDLFNPKVIQSSMGSFLRVKVHYSNLDRLLEELSSASSELPVFASSASGSSIYELELPRKGLILLGNESRGLSAGLLGSAGKRISIPPQQENTRPESLNVAAAAAVICAQFRNYSK
jgi:TrmH family RNA methyltransferase